MDRQRIPEAPAYIRAFEQLGFGMFVHFGLYSQIGKGEWYFNAHNPKMEDYCRLKDAFQVDSMADIVATAKAAGCRYICLTTRHHEGFSLFDTKGLSTFDALHSPCKRDLVAEFTDECRKADIVPFFYHTTLDWYQADFENNFDAYLDYLYQSVELLCTNYGKVGGFWFDGNWSKPEADWKEERLYRMIHRLQPEAMIINNTGLMARGQTGVEEIDAVTFERGMPEPLDLRGRSKYISGEMCETLCDHWGIADDVNYKPVKQLIEELCECRKVGANFLLNIGPYADGTVPKIQAGIMECIGRWMQVYGTAIYNGRPYIAYADKRDFLLKDVNDPSVAYLFHFDPGQSGGDKNVSLSVDAPDVAVLENIARPVASAVWMDNGESLPFRQEEDRLTIRLNGFLYGQSLCVRVAKISFQK